MNHSAIVQPGSNMCVCGMPDDHPVHGFVEWVPKCRADRQCMAIANRIDELLVTHGLADVPDTAAALTPPLPAEPDYCRNCGGRNDNHRAGRQST